jgi:hypothetical protein
MRWKSLAGAVAMATGALVIGALFARPGSGRAATPTQPPANQTLPTISGTPREGQTLQTSNGTWTNSPTAYVYTWSRCDTYGNSCLPIAGAESQTYVLATADVGHTLRVTVVAHNGIGNSEPATSVPTAVVLPAAPANTGAPTISGSESVGSTLTTTNGTWSGTVTGYAYAWERCDATGAHCTAIDGATGQTYKLGTTDTGHRLRVTVTASNTGGSTSATSSLTGVVSAASLPKDTVLPVISGSMQIGATLTATKGTWSGTVTGYAYAWERCDSKGENCATINAATSATYKLTTGDAGSTLRVVVTASNDAGSTAATSAPTAVVSGAPTTGCPAGTGAIQVAQLKPPARLAVSGWSTTGGVVALSATSLQIHVRITACGGRPVQGVTVFAVPIPYNQFKGNTGTTGPSGTVTLTEQRLTGFPANTRHQELLAVLIRASKPGTPLAGGISTRRVVSFKVTGR